MFAVVLKRGLARVMREHTWILLETTRVPRCRRFIFSMLNVEDITFALGLNVDYPGLPVTLFQFVSSELLNKALFRMYFRWHVDLGPLSLVVGFKPLSCCRCGKGVKLWFKRAVQTVTGSQRQLVTPMRDELWRVYSCPTLPPPSPLPRLNPSFFHGHRTHPLPLLVCVFCNSSVPVGVATLMQPVVAFKSVLMTGVDLYGAVESPRVGCARRLGHGHHHRRRLHGRVHKPAEGLATSAAMGCQCGGTRAAGLRGAGPRWGAVDADHHRRRAPHATRTLSCVCLGWLSF